MILATLKKYLLVSGNRGDSDAVRRSFGCIGLVCDLASSDAVLLLKRQTKIIIKDF